jgi:putative hydrolase of HD superfamily
MILTLIEIQRLKGLERTGWMLRGLPPGSESVAEHSFGVAVAAMLLADELIARGVSVDVERLLRLALLHDWAEVRLGDMPRTGSEYFGKEARRRAERRAFDDIVKSLGQRLEKLYGELHEDYEGRTSLEARLVKAADVIDLLVQTLAFERAGARGLDEFWEGITERYFQLDGVAGEVVKDVLRELTQARREFIEVRG